MNLMKKNVYSVRLVIVQPKVPWNFESRDFNCRNVLGSRDFLKKT